MDALAHHWVTWVIAAYSIAAIPVGVMLGRLRGVDIRSVGSGNIGATNATRALGPRLGMVVLVLDVGKAALPVLLARQPFALGAADQVGLAAVAMAAVLGHIFPVYLGFRGGKGVACALGVFVVLDPAVALGALLLYVQTVVLTRTSAVGSLTAVSAMTITLIIADAPPPQQLLSLGIALVIWVRHASNVRGLIAEAKARKRAAKPPLGPPPSA
ncbi:glycerol-3-phosphate acyltransferase [Paraliomyxa miuraensis]|uniref:glycerol-3-phosphate acyltransferase n=1 Tax=Paraliomyxa miuraensis TaxID=376150 RepID=UPI002255EF02|nr:glycerol-3-phosphate acyltransferase [Paraliomyxa miuraensis]MCX4240661.1 glycerol-3-phosphate acyltransferase [Paraliomyxa miuraensis]